MGHESGITHVILKATEFRHVILRSVMLRHVILSEAKK